MPSHPPSMVVFPERLSAPHSASFDSPTECARKHLLAGSIMGEKKRREMPTSRVAIFLPGENVGAARGVSCRRGRRGLPDGSTVLAGRVYFRAADGQDSLMKAHHI